MRERERERVSQGSWCEKESLNKAVGVRESHKEVGVRESQQGSWCVRERERERERESHKEVGVRESLNKEVGVRV